MHRTPPIFAFSLNLSDRASRRARHVSSRRCEFLFPLLGCGAVFRRDRLRGSFASSRVDLLLRIRDQARNLPRKLQ
jgi:hypothetical protein